MMIRFMFSESGPKIREMILDLSNVLSDFLEVSSCQSLEVFGVVRLDAVGVGFGVGEFLPVLLDDRTTVVQFVVIVQHLFVIGGVS